MASFAVILCLSQLLLVSSLSSALQITHVIGKFGTQRVPVDFQFGDDVMVVTTHKPLKSQDTFRETSNLHVFPRRMVAIRNSQDNECYVQPFNATMSGMKERVENAVKYNSDIGQVKEERVVVGGITPLGSDSVEFFLGTEIANFCHLHRVYLIGSEDVHLLDPKEVFQAGPRKGYPVRRRRWRRRVCLGCGSCGGFSRGFLVVC